MIVIKQKWNEVENILIQVPILRHNSQIKNTSYNDFINKVYPLIPSQLPSLLPFIYLKESADEQLINDKLKNGEIIENFNENIFKRIKTEVENILKKEDTLYILQAANSTFKTYIDNKEIQSDLRIEFMRLIGKIISNIEDISNFANFIINHNKNLKDFYYIVGELYNDDKVSIKSKMISYFKEKQDDYTDSQTFLFNMVINDKNLLFTNKEIYPIFTGINGLTEISKNIQNYIELSYKNNKQSFIPESFVTLIVNSISTNTFSEQTRTCLKYFSAEQLSSEVRQQLSFKTNNLISHISTHLQYGTPNITNMIIDTISCLKLLYKNDFKNDTYQNFMQNTYMILDRLRVANDNVRREYSYNFLIEMFWFIDDDSKFANVINRFISSNKTLFISKIKNINFAYIEKIAEYPISQKVILSDAEITNSIYETYSEKIAQNYLLLLRQDGDISNLEKIIKVINEKNITIDKTKFRDDIVQKYIDIGDITLIIAAFNILNKYNYEVTKKQRLGIKNKVIDFYKNDTSNGISILDKMKAFLSQNEFNENILLPIFQYINSELTSTNSVKEFLNIIQVINETFINENIKLLDKIVFALIEDNQDDEEYELAFGLLLFMQKFGNNIDKFREKIEERLNTLNDKFKDYYEKLYPQYNSDLNRNEIKQ